MNAIECLAVLHEENMAMVKRLLRPVDAAVQTEMLDIILTWPREPGEILTPVSTPTEYNPFTIQVAGKKEGESE